MQLLLDLLIAFMGTNIDNFVFITLMLAASLASAQKQRSTSALRSSSASVWPAARRCG